jgi:predicted nucleic acid-binding protein
VPRQYPGREAGPREFWSRSEAQQILGAIAASASNRHAACWRPAHRERSKRTIAWTALEAYEVDRLDSAEAYLVAQAEATGINEVRSFDRSIDKIQTVTRREP